MIQPFFLQIFHKKIKGHNEVSHTSKDKIKNGTRIRYDKNGFSQIIFRERALEKELKE